MRRRALLSTGIAALGSVAGCVGAFGTTVSEAVSESFEVSPETVVSISNRNGDVTVDPTDADELTVTALKEASSEEALDSTSLEVTTGERFLVEVTFAPGSDFDSRSVDLTVEVPDRVRVDRARTENGDVSAGGVGGDLAATTTNGDVELHGVDGYVDAETTNGDVTVRDATGLDGAGSENGDVDVDCLAMRGDVTCRTTSGDVTVSVGQDVSAAVRLETTNGSVSVADLPVSVDGERRGFLRGQLRNGSDSTLSLRSTNGDVTLDAA